MTQFNLSTLSARELRRLLDSTRERGQAAQAYDILKEMARRRERNGAQTLFAALGPEEPRTIDVDLGDPMAPKPEAFDDVDDVVDDTDDGEDALTLGPSEPYQPDDQAPLEVEMASAFGRPQRRSKIPMAALATGGGFGAALGVFVGLSVAEMSLPAKPEPAAAQFAAAPAVMVPGPRPAPVLPVAVEDPVAEASTEVAAADELPDAVGPAASVEEATLAQDAVETAAPAPAPAAPKGTPILTPVKETQPPETAEPDPAATADAKRCAGAGTPADRTICADPELQKLQKELRQAYAEALKAHADRTTLRERQLAWRDGRSEVSDPARLTSLYEQRIRKLNAATVAARKSRGL